MEADLHHGRGWFEVQDEGSQIAAALTGAKTGERVLDLCAGAGGKTLAMAAAMDNRGVLVAYDEDKMRLRPIMERLTRSGVTIVEPLAADDLAQVSKRGPEFDCVLVDAPCTGSGTWRRKPDAKWRLKPKNLVTGLEEQRTVLAEAARHVRPGGRLVYVTCSVFAAENGDQVTAFADAHPEYRIVATADMAIGASQGALTALPQSASSGPGLQLTPASHGTDGFYVAVLLQADRLSHRFRQPPYGASRRGCGPSEAGRDEAAVLRGSSVRSSMRSNSPSMTGPASADRSRPSLSRLSGQGCSPSRGLSPSHG